MQKIDSKYFIDKRTVSLLFFKCVIVRQEKHKHDDRERVRQSDETKEKRHKDRNNQN